MPGIFGRDEISMKHWKIMKCLQTTSFIVNICDPRASIHSNLHDTLKRSNLNRNPFAI